MPGGSMPPSAGGGRGDLLPPQRPARRARRPGPRVRRRGGPAPRPGPACCADAPMSGGRWRCRRHGPVLPPMVDSTHWTATKQRRPLNNRICRFDNGFHVAQNRRPCSPSGGTSNGTTPSSHPTFSFERSWARSQKEPGISCSAGPCPASRSYRPAADLGLPIRVLAEYLLSYLSHLNLDRLA